MALEAIGDRRKTRRRTWILLPTLSEHQKTNNSGAKANKRKAAAGLEPYDLNADSLKKAKEEAEIRRQYR